jgi:hypothetical protein
VGFFREGSVEEAGGTSAATTEHKVQKQSKTGTEDFIIIFLIGFV